MVKKVSEEQKQAAYETWQSGPENTAIQNLGGARTTFPTIDQGTSDITFNMDIFLKELYELGSVLKVPGRKAKCMTVIYNLNRVRVAIHQNHVFRQM